MWAWHLGRLYIRDFRENLYILAKISRLGQNIGGGGGGGGGAMAPQPPPMPNVGIATICMLRVGDYLERGM